MTPAQLDQPTTALYFDNTCPWRSAVLDCHHAVTSGKAGLNLVPFDGQIQTDHQLQKLARLGIVT
jgi:hypothetical protein